jgi:capsular exopolysaccharide synthesis family protein
VLIVDTDLRRPRLHRTFRVSNDVGVTMVTTQQAALTECVQDTGIENLSVLTSGPIPPNPAELLQSDRFRELVKELTLAYDRVVFDSPPILPVTDATILSKLVDGVVIVVRGFKTQKSAVARAVRLFVDVKAHVIGVLLNAIDLDRADYKGYHYYYQTDGYYSRDRDEPSAHDVRPVRSKEGAAPPAN